MKADPRLRHYYNLGKILPRGLKKKKTLERTSKVKRETAQHKGAFTLGVKDFNIKFLTPT